MLYLLTRIDNAHERRGVVQLNIELKRMPPFQPIRSQGLSYFRVRKCIVSYRQVPALVLCTPRLKDIACDPEFF